MSLSSLGYLLEAKFSLNGLDLVFVANSEVHFLDWNERELSAKIFLFPEGDEESYPIIEILVKDYNDSSACVSIQRWLANSESRPLLGEFLVDDNSPYKAALILMNYFYRLKYKWIENPTLKIILDQVGSRKRYEVHF